MVTSDPFYGVFGGLKFVILLLDCVDVNALDLLSSGFNVLINLSGLAYSMPSFVGCSNRSAFKFKLMMTPSYPVRGSTKLYG